MRSISGIFQSLRKWARSGKIEWYKIRVHCIKEQHNNRAKWEWTEGPSMIIMRSLNNGYAGLFFNDICQVFCPGIGAGRHGTGQAGT